MGLTERTERVYLSVGFGCLRKKCASDDPKAVKRETDKGVSYAIEYTSITGRLEGIIFRDDPNYGRSWCVRIEDAGTHYQIQISEESRYATDFLERVPNLHQGEVYKITPYDFEDVKVKKTRRGLSIKRITIKAEEKIGSFYKSYDEDKKQWNYLHGYPPYDPSVKDDKDELKIYFTRVLKFLRIEAQKFIESTDFTAVIEDHPESETEKADDLPF